MHIDLDSFFVSVERKKDPSLNAKPVIVGGSSNRGVVASCSYEARKFGVHSAMPVARARQLCPDAVIVPGDHAQYSMYSNVITDIIREDVPVYEKSSIDEFYIDLSGMERFFGAYRLATALRQRIIRETGLPVSFALSANKTVSKIGTGQAKPNGQIEIPAGKEKEFLAPLSVRKIPGVGEKCHQALLGMGIVTIKDAQERTAAQLERALGEAGSMVWKKANAIDDSPVEPYDERKSISTECTFMNDTSDADHLKRVLISMTEKLTFQLRGEEMLTGCVAVKVRYSDFTTQTMQVKIPYTVFDHTLIEKVKETFGKLHRKNAALRLIGVRFSHLIHGSYQYNLFDDAGEHADLYKTMDRLRQKFGSDAVMRAASLGLDERNRNPFLRD